MSQPCAFIPASTSRWTRLASFRFDEENGTRRVVSSDASGITRRSCSRRSRCRRARRRARRRHTGLARRRRRGRPARVSNPLSTSAGPEPEHRRFAGAGDHHTEAVLAEDGHDVELDGEGLVAFVDGAPALGRAHPARVDPAMTGIEEHRLARGRPKLADTRRRRRWRRERIERSWLSRPSAQDRGHCAVPGVQRGAGDARTDTADDDQSAAQAAGRTSAPGPMSSSSEASPPLRSGSLRRSA